MGLLNPNVTSKPFSDVYEEGQTFTLDGIRVVEATSKEYGKGQMVLLRVRGVPEELSLWGAYLVKQAEAVERADLGQQYKIDRNRVPGFSERPVKMLIPAQDDDIPFER